MKKWWDRKCTKKKRLIKASFRKWKHGYCDKEEYLQRRKDWKVLCVEKMKKKKDEELEKIKQIRKESEVWKYFNKYRKKKSERYEKQINLENWKDHFWNLLEGSDERILGEKRKIDDLSKITEEEEEITEYEIRNVWRIF